MFHPSAAEFENPMEYILSIRETAERFGICWCSAPRSEPAAPTFASRCSRLRQYRAASKLEAAVHAGPEQAQVPDARPEDQ